jgi:hypothetical protein
MEDSEVEMKMRTAACQTMLENGSFCGILRVKIQKFSAPSAHSCIPNNVRKRIILWYFESQNTKNFRAFGAHLHDTDFTFWKVKQREQ